MYDELARILARHLLLTGFPRQIDVWDADATIQEWLERDVLGLFLMNMSGEGTMHDERWAKSTGMSVADAQGDGWRAAYKEDEITGICKAEAVGIIEGKHFYAPGCIAKTGQRVIAQGSPIVCGDEVIQFLGIITAMPI